VVNLPMLEGFLKEHKTIGLDSNILIYFIEAHPSYQNVTTKLFESIEKGRNLGICSSLSLLEILVQPYRRKNDEPVNQFYALMTTFPNLFWKQLTLEIADLGARLRAKYSIKTPDAILLATAIQAGATGFVGNDLQLKKVQEIDTLVLD
jgi:predicted nucleic acid-binding protein